MKKRILDVTALFVMTVSIVVMAFKGIGIASIYVIAAPLVFMLMLFYFAIRIYFENSSLAENISEPKRRRHFRHMTMIGWFLGIVSAVMLLRSFVQFPHDSLWLGMGIIGMCLAFLIWLTAYTHTYQAAPKY